MRLTLLESRLTDHERRHDEFMLRTDNRLESLIKSTARMQQQFSEWTGVRKALFAVSSVIVFVGGVIGWMFHYFWPSK